MVSPTLTQPLSRPTSPMMVFKKVVLPAPFGPTRPIFSPFENAYEKPSRICFFEASPSSPPNASDASSNSTITSPMRLTLLSTRSTVLALLPLFPARSVRE